MLSNCNKSSVGIIYTVFTNGCFNCQCYLNSSLSLYKIRTIARFRTSNHKLPIETGRWNNVDRENRKCWLCNVDIGDE